MQHIGLVLSASESLVKIPVTEIHRFLDALETLPLQSSESEAKSASPTTVTYFRLRFWDNISDWREIRNFLYYRNLTKADYQVEGLSITQPTCHAKHHNFLATTAKLTYVIKFVLK